MNDSSKWGVHLPFGPYTSQAWGAVWVGGSDEDWVYIGEGGGLWTRERGCSGLAAGGAQSGGSGTGGRCGGGNNGRGGKRARDAHGVYIM